jgi:hypothetical protein
MPIPNSCLQLEEWISKILHDDDDEELHGTDTLDGRQICLEIDATWILNWVRTSVHSELAQLNA